MKYPENSRYFVAARLDSQLASSACFEYGLTLSELDLDKLLFGTPCNNMLSQGSSALQDLETCCSQDFLRSTLDLPVFSQTSQPSKQLVCCALAI